MSDREQGYYDYLNRISAVVPASLKMYLVGGAVRDLILNKPLHDYDFVLEGLVREIGKRIADAFNAKFYVMDEEREIVRVMINEGDRFVHFDFAKIVGGTLEDDLRNRDFTINAIAIDFRDRQTFVDPLGGMSDLREKRLRMCLPDSLRQDPIRAVRGLRFALEYGLSMDDELLHEMNGIPAFLPKCSLERYRDEIFKLLKSGKSVSIIQALERFSILDFLFPNDTLNSTDALIDRARSMDHLLSILTTGFQEAESSNLISGLAVLKLGAYRTELRSYFDAEKNYLRDRRSVLRFALLAALYKVDPKSEPQREILNYRSRQLVLSGDEIRNIAKMFEASSEILAVVESGDTFADTDIYRFFKKYSDAAIEGVFLYLANAYEKAALTPDLGAWTDALDTAAKLFEARFRRYDSVICPEPYLNGAEIIRLLGLTEGPEIGELKERLIEAQIVGAVTSRSEAAAYIESLRAP